MLPNGFAPLSAMQKELRKRHAKRVRHSFRPKLTLCTWLWGMAMSSTRAGRKPPRIPLQDTHAAIVGTDEPRRPPGCDLQLGRAAQGAGPHEEGDGALLGANFDAPFTDYSDAGAESLSHAF